MMRWQAEAGDDEEAREDFMDQVPIEAICDHRPENLVVHPRSHAPRLPLAV